MVYRILNISLSYMYVRRTFRIWCSISTSHIYSHFQVQNIIQLETGYAGIKFITQLVSESKSAESSLKLSKSRM